MNANVNGKPQRIYFRPTGLHSRAMLRVADALERSMPQVGYVKAGSPSANFCDVQVLHVISSDAIEHAAILRARGQRYIVIQYQLLKHGGIDWHEMWRGAELVWSYYDLTSESEEYGFNFLHSPLGVDDVFRCKPYHYNPRRNLVVTTGHVNGIGAEPIKVAWEAAKIAGLPCVHVGPGNVLNMGEYPTNWNAVKDVTDTELASIYHCARFVSGLRYVEGFELPAAEGLVCGATPIVFNQPSMCHWYDTHALYVDESEQALIGDLARLLSGPVATLEEAVLSRQFAINRFDWAVICKAFWAQLERIVV